MDDISQGSIARVNSIGVYVYVFFIERYTLTLGYLLDHGTLDVSALLLT